MKNVPHCTTTYGRVGVLAGGPSSERDISLRSGKAVHAALLAEGIDAVLLDVGDDIRAQLQTTPIDIAFIALHGRFGEDGTVQEILRDARIPYTGSNSTGSRNAFDKVIAKELFVRHQVATPRYVVVDDAARAHTDALPFGLPVVVKPHQEGSSIGLSVVRDAHTYGDAVARALQYSAQVVVEEYIDGRELTVGILDDQPLPVVEIVPQNKIYDYAAKYSDPGTQYLVPAPLDPAIADRAGKLALRAHRALGCTALSRVDIMMNTAGELFVLEVNTIPGMTERSLLPKAAHAIGLSFGQLCVKLITLALDQAHTYLPYAHGKK